MSGSDALRAVLGSTVRTDLLVAVADTPQPTAGLKQRVDASESAVYDALGTLERRGLVRSVEGVWELTGSGRVVADLLVQVAGLDQLLAGDYWERHDVALLPRPFRLRLTDLADAEVFRAPDTDPHAVVRQVSDRVQAGSPNVDIATPIYQAEYEAVMPDDENARLLIDPAVIEDAVERMDAAPRGREFEDTKVRFLAIDVAIGVTDEHLMLSLPTIDGQYDSRTEVFATADRAIEWGRDLFECYWERATPDAQPLDGASDGQHR